MEKTYFVILRYPNGDYITPLVDDQFDLCQFATEEEAREAAESSFLGSEIGYEVFDFREAL